MRTASVENVLTYSEDSCLKACLCTPPCVRVVVVGQTSVINAVMPPASEQHVVDLFCFRHNNIITFTLASLTTTTTTTTTTITTILR